MAGRVEAEARRPSRPRISAAKRLVAVGVLGLFALVAAMAPATAFADTTNGYDVSYPQCGHALPSGRPDVAIVGVEGGRSYTMNRCLADQFHWAGAMGHHYEVYINTSFPAGSKIHRGDTGPKGTCRPEDWACRAYNYGFNNAEFAFQYAQSQYAVADTWWLDVETANSWNDTPALNDPVIQGAVDSLRAHQLHVGIYSIPPMWRKIAGSYIVDVPKWVVRLRESVPTSHYCAAANGFGGGAVALVQVEGGALDEDYLCPIDAFAGQASFVPIPLTGTQSGELAGTHGGSSTFYTLPSAGTGATQSATVDFTPVGADLANALYVTVFQGNAELANVGGTETPTPGHLHLSFTSSGSDPIVVRVQNFNVENLPPIQYTISPN
jgi:hypothetical protein